MAKTPILKIDVDDSQFKAFYELYKEYETKAGELPESMQEANRVLNAGMAAVVEQTHNISKNLHLAIEAQKQFARATHSGEHGLKSMANYAKSVYESFFKVEKFVLKFGAYGLGLFGAATFGLDKLANSALGSAVQARGIGTNIGGLRAWQTDYAQIAPKNLPESVYGAQQNLQDRGLLSYATGLSPDAAATLDPVALSELIVRKAHDYYQANKGNPTALTSQMPMMRAFAAMGLNVEGVTQAGNTPTSQIVAAQMNLANDRTRLDYTNKTLAGLQQFWQQLRIAGQALETDLSQHLSVLGKKLGGFIGQLENDAEILLNKALSPQNMQEIATGLDKFTKFLASGEVETDIKKFGNSLGSLASMIEKIAHPEKAAEDLLDKGKKEIEHLGAWGVLHKLGITASAGKPHSLNDWLGLTPQGAHAGVRLLQGLSQGPLGVHGSLWTVDHATAKKLAPSLGVPMTAEQLKTLRGAAAAADAKYGLLPGTIETNTLLESGNRMGAVSKAGAIGPEQFMPATAKWLGLDNPNDITSSVDAAGKYWKMLVAKAKRLAPQGNMLLWEEMARGEFDMGPNAFAGALASGRPLPRETRKTVGDFGIKESDYLARYTQALTKTRTVMQARGPDHAPAVTDKSAAYLHQIARNTARPMKVHITTSTPTAARVAIQANASGG